MIPAIIQATKLDNAAIIQHARQHIVSKYGGLWDGRYVVEVWGGKYVCEVAQGVIAVRGKWTPPKGTK